MSTAEERKALIAATFRDANESLEASAREIYARDGGLDAASLVPLLCECHNVGCAEVVLLTFAEYTEVRAGERRSLTKVGHDDPAIERVICSNDRFVTTEKFGRAGEVFADRADSDPA